MKYEQDVAAIVDDCNKKFSMQNKKAQKVQRKRFTQDGRASSVEKYGMYTMPTMQVMRQNLKHTEEKKKRQMMKELSNN